MENDERNTGSREKPLLWDSALVVAARDILFLALVFLYLIGFFYHAAWVKGFGVGVEFVDQPTWQMLEWAWDAVQTFPWMFAYLAILFMVFAVMSYAGYIRQTGLAVNARLRPIVYGLVFGAIMGGVALTIFTSSYEGKRAALSLRQGEPFSDPSIHFTAKSEAKTILEASPTGALLQWYLIAESADRYHLFRRDDCGKRSSPAVYSILKADVISYDQSPPQDSPTSTAGKMSAAKPTPRAPSPPARLLHFCP